LKLRRQSFGTGLIGIGNPYDFHERQAAQRAGVIRADVSGAHQSDFDKLVPFQNLMSLSRFAA